MFSHEGLLIRGESLTSITKSQKKGIFDTVETDISKSLGKAYLILVLLKPC